MFTIEMVYLELSKSFVAENRSDYCFIAGDSAVSLVIIQHVVDSQHKYLLFTDSHITLTLKDYLSMSYSSSIIFCSLSYMEHLERLQ